MTELSPKRRAPILDGRLSAAFALARDCRFFADIGADHGRLSAALLLADSGRRGLVADISPLALSKARSRIHSLRLDERVRFAVADGLDALEDAKADTVLILGMGGDTIRGILTRGVAHLHGAALILGPHTDAPLVRQALMDIGYRIRQEQIVRDAGRDYLLLRATPAVADEPPYTEEELWLGPVLLREHPASWLPVLQRRKRLLGQGIRAMRETPKAKDAQRLCDYEREYGYVLRALARFGKEAEP